MKQFLILCLIIILANVLQAQPVALKKFLQTEFISEFDSIANRAEKSVRDFKAIQDLYEEEDIIRVRDVYNASANLFNAALVNVKNDMLNKDKRKFISKYPEDYSKQMMLDLYQAKEFYENEYGLVLDEVTEGKVDNIFPFVALATIFKWTQKGVEYFRGMNDQWGKINTVVLDEFLIEAHQFKKWEEIF